MTIVAFFLFFCAVYTISQPIETIASDPGILSAPNVSYIGLWFEIPYFLIAAGGGYLLLRRQVNPYLALAALIIAALFSGWLTWASASTTNDLLNDPDSDPTLVQKCVNSSFVWFGFFASAVIMCVLLKKGYQRTIQPAYA